MKLRKERLGEEGEVLETKKKKIYIYIYIYVIKTSSN